MVDGTYPKEDLLELRKELGLTQQEMANRLDMALRSYQAIEAGESAYRHIHRLAVERVALTIAADRKAPMLAPVSVRSDAIELVRVGQATRNPEFLGGKKDNPANQVEPADEKFRAAYGVVGELVLLTTALDHQLNHILIQALPLAESPMLEAVVATLDMNRKIEMLKARAKHISNPTWHKALQGHLEKLEQISSWRNIACHTALIPDEQHGAVFAPAAAAKLLKNLQLGESPASRKIPIGDFSPKIRLGESALFDGQQLIHNFERANAERTKRYPSNSRPPAPEDKAAGMILTTYLDESGTHAESPISVMAGYVGTTVQWERFEADWSALVREAGVKHIHAVELFKRTKQFKGWKAEDVNVLAASLNNVIDRHLQVGFTIVVRDDDYSSIYKADPHPKRLPKDTKYGVIFRACLAFVPSFIASQFNSVGQTALVQNSTINFVLENGHRNVGDAQRLFKLFKEDALPEWRKLVGTMDVTTKDSAGAQAADFLAYTAYRAECLEHGRTASVIQESSLIVDTRVAANSYPPRPEGHRGAMIFRIPIGRETLQSLKDDLFAREAEPRAPVRF
jgi:transcriptional regulator with XRE-family HTH domain